MKKYFEKIEDWIFEHDKLCEIYLWTLRPFRKLGDLKRTIKYGFQRMFRGYDDTAKWSLDKYLTKIIIPVLKNLKQNGWGYPSKLKNAGEWKKILQEMITTFEILQRDDIKELIKKEKQIQKGLGLFAKWYRNLWD